jgi:MoaA/NifB/PqqE/SkfB family radical SAM enzyme
METESLIEVKTFSQLLQANPGGKKMPSQKMISGFRARLIEFQVLAKILFIIIRNYHNPVKSFKILGTLRILRKKAYGESRVQKIARVDGKYYWNLYSPGYKSKAFDNFFQGEANRIYPLNKKCNRFTNIFIAVTKKCALQCEHCLEWDSLNGKEKLSLQDLKSIVLKFQNLGTSQVQLSGGEPMLRVNDIAEILKSASNETEFWILTSGYKFTYENAHRLKQAGLTGVVVSLDHFDPAQHNLFRGFKNSFEWVEEAVRNAIANNLVTALSICVTKSFATEPNLYAYADLAKKMGVSFIQILEPREVGHYKGQDVSLKKEHEQILETFYLKMNFDKKYKEYPIITYHGFHQRQSGCFSSGDRNLYVDTDGDLHACPFCQTKTGSALSDDIDNSIQQLQLNGCHKFKSVSI